MEHKAIRSNLLAALLAAFITDTFKRCITFSLGIVSYARTHARTHTHTRTHVARALTRMHEHKHAHSAHEGHVEGRRRATFFTTDCSCQGKMDFCAATNIRHHLSNFVSVSRPSLFTRCVVRSFNGVVRFDLQKKEGALLKRDVTFGWVVLRY